MNNKILAVIAVVIIVAAGCSVILLTKNGSDENSRIKTDEVTAVYGNANYDYALDDLDVKFLEDIVSGKTTWDKTKYPLADANQDGEITQADIDLVKKIINKEKCTVYYQDYYGDVTAVNFPLSDRNIAVTYYQQAEACAILGVLDNVTVASKAATVYSDLWPTLNDAVEWGTTGSSAITDDAVEKFIDNDVTLVICTPRTENRELAQRLHEERGIDFIQLWYNGNYCISTIQTMAILMDCQERSEKYKSYCEGIADELSSKITAENKKNILVANGYNASNDQLSILGNERHGSYVLMNKYLGNAYYEDGTNQFGFVYKNVEWLVENSQKFDYIVLCQSGNAGFSNNQTTGEVYTHEEYNTQFEEAVSYFGKVKAYEDGNVIGSVYPNTFGFSAYPFLKLIAAQMYPDLFSLEDAVNDIQEWFDTFGVVSIDVSEFGAYSYTGDGYHANYPQQKA